MELYFYGVVVEDSGTGVSVVKTRIGQQYGLVASGISLEEATALVKRYSGTTTSLPVVKIAYTPTPTVKYRISIWGNRGDASKPTRETVVVTLPRNKKRSLKEFSLEIEAEAKRSFGGNFVTTNPLTAITEIR